MLQLKDFGHVPMISSQKSPGAEEKKYWDLNSLDVRLNQGTFVYSINSVYLFILMLT